MSTQPQTATFGAGCFWGVEELFRGLEGVLQTSVGYMGGTVANPSYEQVCTGETGHAEVVQVTYDPSVISYDELLNAFWSGHDPTQINRQGHDVGSQYRTVIFYYTDEQHEAAEASKQRQQESSGNNVSTTIEPAGEFYPAEEYHQKYLAKRGQSSCPI